MKVFFSRNHFPIVVSLLLLATLFTIPSAVTQSKYVWEEDIDITLKIIYPEQEVTSLFMIDPNAASILDDNRVQIGAAGMADPWILSPEKGDTLPESLKLQARTAPCSLFPGDLYDSKGMALDQRAEG